MAEMNIGFELEFSSHSLVFTKSKQSLVVNLPDGNGDLDLSKAKAAGEIVTSKCRKDVASAVGKTDAAIGKLAVRHKKGENVGNKAETLVKGLNDAVTRMVASVSPNVRKAVALVLKLSPSSIQVTSRNDLRPIKLAPGMFEGAPDDGGGDDDLVALLKKKGKWMFCGVAYLGTTARIRLNHKKALTKNELKDLKKEVGAAAVLVEGVCKTGMPVTFRFVDGKAPPKKKVLKEALETQSGKAYKVEVGDSLAQMPPKLSGLD